MLDMTFLPTILSVDSLCLDAPGWEIRSKHPFDVIIQVRASVYFSHDLCK